MANKYYVYASPRAPAQEACEKFRAYLSREGLLVDRVEDCDVLLVLGGDGTCLDALQLALVHGKPVFGVNYGDVGHLLNPRLRNLGKLDELIEVLKKNPYVLKPLLAEFKLASGKVVSRYAFNDVVLYAETGTVGWFCVEIDGIKRIPELRGDGILLATPTGSTSYNIWAGGHVLPVLPPANGNDDQYVLTPFRGNVRMKNPNNNSTSFIGHGSAILRSFESIVISSLRPHVKTDASSDTFKVSKEYGRDNHVEQITIRPDPDETHRCTLLTSPKLLYRKAMLLQFPTTSYS